MKTILTVSSIVEGITSLSLILVPHWPISILLGVSMYEPIGIRMSQLAGVALLSLSIACWLYRRKSEVDGIIKVMLFYNIGASCWLAYVKATGLSGLGLWPAFVFHVILAVWCIKTMRTVRENVK